MNQHFQIHRVTPRKRGAQPRIHGDEHSLRQLTYEKVQCQRFFSAGPASSYFTIQCARGPEEADETRPWHRCSDRDLIRAQINQELVTHERDVEEQLAIYQATQSPVAVDPWLEAAQWPSYFHGRTPTKIAELSYLPDQVREGELQLITESLDRIVERAYKSICEDEISVFDRYQINSFVDGLAQRAQDRMLLVKLKKQTFREYKALWKRLLCFVCRTAQDPEGCCSPPLPHVFTETQLDRIQSILQEARRLLAYTKVSALPPDREDHLDHACLRLCISLLDHQLRGSLFESPVLGFLAILGLREKEEGFHDAASYSPRLSKFIKIAQMLVIRQAVVSAQAGDCMYPSDMLDELRQRFLVRGSRTPFDWACRLRQTAKRIASTVTRGGSLVWSDDFQKISFQDVSFTLTDLRALVATQVQLAQEQLHALFLLPADDVREDVVPPVQLYRLEDNPSQSRRHWNFLKDSRNADALYQPKLDSGRWILDRVLQDEALRDSFITSTKTGKVRWLSRRVDTYFKDVDGFLERLLLLIHLTSGQPARGTELLSLQFMNSAQGHRRNIFLENGLVSTVTEYHKGYSTTGSIKTIHRYLPKEVSELLVYYLWLVLPFWQQLDALAHKRTDPPSPYLWPTRDQTWSSARLTRVLVRETYCLGGMALNTNQYRHIAIAISRQHLQGGGFKRDYGVGKDISADEQAAHKPLFAGLVYARGLEEAPGHVTARKVQYRQICCQWHELLGFNTGSRYKKRTREQTKSDDLEWFWS